MSQSHASASVPPNWVHPDLKRQLMDARRNEATERIEKLEGYNVVLNKHALETSTGLHQKRHHLTALERQVQQLKTDIAEMESDETEVKDALGVVVHQLTHHRNGVAELRSVPGSRTQSYEVMAGHEVWPTDVEPFAANLEPFFAHFLWRPFTSFSPVSVDHAKAAKFLKHFAPLFEWESASASVKPRSLFAKPCLMESPGASCPIPGCLYLHTDPLAHLRMSLLPLVSASAAFHVRDQRVDCVAELLASWRVACHRCRTAEELNSSTAHVLRQIIGHGWYAFFLPREESVWKAPVLAGAETGSTAAPLAVDELRNEAERECWRAVLECADLDIPAAQMFVDTPDAILWRCMIRTSAQTAEQRLWLTRRGIDVYPGSPHLQVHYVLALLDTDAPAEECFKACLQAVSALSAQTCAAAVIPGEAAVGAAATVSRYTAYLIARCAVHLAMHSAVDVHEDASNSESHRIPGYAEQLLTLAIQNEGREAGLLPTATVNLTLMLISLLQCHGLAHMECLPLGAVSDQVFTFSQVARLRPQDGCVHRLNGLLGMLSSLHRHALDPVLIATLKAAVQLSLQRSFSIQLHFVEQIMRKWSVTASLVASTLWCEYVRCVAQHDSPDSATRLAMELLEGPESEPPCLLTWLLIDHLAVNGDARAHGAMSRAATRACAGFEAMYGTRQGQHDEEADGTTASGHSEAQSDPVELAAYHVLRAQSMPQTAERAAYLNNVSITALLPSSDAMLLFLLAQLKLCVLGDDRTAFRRILRDRLAQLREGHLLWWSPLDVWYSEVVGVPHMVSLCVYRAIPSLVASRGDLTMTFREIVLEVGSSLHVLHPLLEHSAQ